MPADTTMPATCHDNPPGDGFDLPFSKLHTTENIKEFSVEFTDDDGTPYSLVATVRYDDTCRNGHNTFSITGELCRIDKYGVRRFESGGCIHEVIAERIPALAPFIKWHLCSSDGPMGYPGNALYFSHDRDHWGLLAGEKRQIRRGGTGALVWKLAAFDANGNELEVRNIPQYPEGETAPDCPYTLRYVPWCRVGEGKPRDLDAARRSAIWLDATDDELNAPDLEQRLTARLPALLSEFRAAVESLGFVF